MPRKGLLFLYYLVVMASQMILILKKLMLLCLSLRNLILHLIIQMILNSRN
uniref:Uncharacterized protein n=1 Tax=Arundo donax TaxID=35708 RepID=A0A0A9DHK0_ARUDO